MPHSQLSLKWLLVFRSVAQGGSVDAASKQLGLSSSTVSHHLAKLEAHLGTALLDHKRRPMELTVRGVTYLRYVEEALGLLDMAKQQVTVSVPHGLHHLRFAMIEDFESEVGPDVTRMMAKILPSCQFTHLTRVSHEILSLLQQGELDLGIATKPQFALPDAEEYPILRDPFVLAVPAGASQIGQDYVTGLSPLPFLRYTETQIMGGLIAAQLRRLRLHLDHHFELDSTSAIMGLIAQNGGWAITTPSNFMRSKRFQSQIKLLPFPGKEFARTISVFSIQPQPDELAKSVATAMRALLATHAIAPIVSEYPWLASSFRLLAADPINQ